MSSSALLPLFSALKRPVIAAAAAGAGSAAVWTFWRDLLTSTGGLPERTTAVLWCLLGAGAVLGAVSGDAVRRWGLGRAWVVTALATAAGTALFAVAASHAVTAELAGALFGGAYTALSGVLIAWAGGLRPDAVGRGTAVLFVALTTGQALGALGTGMLITRRRPWRLSGRRRAAHVRRRDRPRPPGADPLSRGAESSTRPTVIRGGMACGCRGAWRHGLPVPGRR